MVSPDPSLSPFLFTMCAMSWLALGPPSHFVLLAWTPLPVFILLWKREGERESIKEAAPERTPQPPTEQRDSLDTKQENCKPWQKTIQRRAEWVNLLVMNTFLFFLTCLAFCSTVIRVHVLYFVSMGCYNFFSSWAKLFSVAALIFLSQKWKQISRKHRLRRFRSQTGKFKHKS